MDPPASRQYRARFGLVASSEAQRFKTHDCGRLYFVNQCGENGVTHKRHVGHVESVIHFA
jgi:hypothetical protein